MSETNVSQRNITLQFDVLQAVNRLISSEDATESILKSVLSLLFNRMSYQAVQIYQLTTTEKDVWLYLETGNSRKPVTQSMDIFSIDEVNIISDSIRQNKSIYIPDVAGSPYSYFGEAVQITGAEVAQPLVFGSTKLGVLRIQRDSPNSFDQDELSFLHAISSLIATTLRNNRTIERLQDSIQEIKTLYTVQYKNRLEQQRYFSTSAKSIGFEYDNGEISRTHALSDVVDTHLQQTDNQAEILSHQTNGTKALLAPIKLHNEIIGVLGIEDLAETTPVWAEEDISLLEEVTSQVALAIENARLLQQTREQTNELTILFEATRQLTETINLQEIYEILTSHILSYLHANRATVLLINEARTHFEAFVTRIHHKERMLTVADTRIEAIESLPVFRQLIKQPEIKIKQADDPNLSANIRKYIQKNNDVDTQTLTIFPLLVRNNLVGIMEVEHHADQHHYTKNELQLAQAIITQVTVAIENAQLFQQTQQSLQDTQKLYEISRRMVESTTVEDIFNIILETVKAYNIDRVSISLLDRSPNGDIESVSIAASWDRDPNRQVPVGTRFYTTDFSLVNSFAQPPFAPLMSHNLRHPEQDDRMDEGFRLYALNQIGAFTLFSAPMFLGAEYKGVLSIYTRTPHTYSDREIRIYQTLADQAIIALENYRLLHATRLERDRASLLYELGQSLSQVTTVEQVQNVVIDIMPSVGALDGELYITDGVEFSALASTIVERQNLPPETLLQIMLGSDHEAQALTNRHVLRLTKNSTTRRQWPLKNIPGMAHIQSIVCVPFFSQRSTLQGVISFFHSEAEAFTDEQVSMFETLAIQTSTTLENVWLLRQTNMVLLDTELLYNVTRGFNSAQTADDIIRVMADNMPDSGVDVMAIALVSKRDRYNAPLSLHAPLIWQKETDEITLSNMYFEAGIYDFVKNLRADSHLEIYYNDLKQAAKDNLQTVLNDVRSILAIPLTVGKNWLGHILLASKIENYEFNTSIISQISTIAGQAAVVIRNIDLVEKTQQNLYNSEVLSNLGKQLLAAESVESIYNLALEAIAATEPDRGAALFMYDQTSGSVDLELKAMWDNTRKKWPAVVFDSRLSAAEVGLLPLLKTDLTLVSTNGPVDNRFSAPLQQLLQQFQIKSLVVVSLWLQKDVVGFILVGHEHDNPFSSETIRLYEDIARETSGALENQRLFDEVEYRAWQLQTAADISQAATASLDLDTLLFESVELLKKRFNFYHASIFLVDEYRHFAVIRASTGEIGQSMLAMEHKLEVGGKSIVGTATSTGKPKIALDVGKDAVHFNNPLLPETRSEMALPLIAQGEVIGALDVQSTKRSAFTQGDIAVLQSMANQLANAIEAARSYQESKKSLAEVSKVHQRYLTDQWTTYLAEHHAAVGYHLEENGDLKPITDQNAGKIDTPAITLAKSPTILPVKKAANGQQQAEKEQSKLVAPLTLYGQSIIGHLDLDLPAYQKDDLIWNEDMLEIVEAVSGQAAQAIEAARLFEQSQVAREEAQALYQVGRSLVTMETETEMFYTVLDKMLSTLGLGQGGVLLFHEDRQYGTLLALYEDGQPVKDPDLQFPVADNGSYQQLIATKRPVVIEDMATDPLVEKVREAGLVGNITSLLLVPIIINDEAVGAIGADSVGKIHHFSDRELDLAMAMADQLSIALQNRRLIRETSQRANLLQTSSDVGRAATSILDEDILIDQTIELIIDGFGFQSVQIYLPDLRNNKILRPHKYMEFGLTEQIKVGDDHAIGRSVLTRKSAVVRYQTNADKTDASILSDPQSELAVPLQVGNTLIGVIDVQSTDFNAFTEEEISTLETLSAQLAVAIQNARTFREQQETAERLKEIDKLKTQFLANMSHELRTPLNSIIGFSRVILKGIDGPLTDLQKADLTSIYNSGQHLLGLINNILDLSKIEAGKMELNFEEVELEPVIKTVMSTAIALIKGRPVDLVQEVAEDMPIIWADPTRIRQVILNLVSNACKFTDEGAIVVRAKPEQNHVVISVNDTGIGIPEEKIENIFEEFTQVDGSTTRKVGGTGLGLPISRHFVEMHRGNIWVESKLGYGTTFYFTLPISPPSDNTDLIDNIEEAVEQSAKDNRVIVAVDDDPAVLDLYKRYLEKQNYTVIGVTNGNNALAVVKEHCPRAVLLDIIIPDKDGWSVIKELKEDTFTKNIPVIICSIVSDKNRGFSLGASDYLVKPIVENQLTDVLKKLNSRQKDEIKVLVVDDQADDILLLRRILEAQPDYTIFEAANGEEGLDLIQSNSPDLIILDLNMPQMDGFAMIEALKGNAATRNIPIIIVSAQDLTHDEQEKLTGQVEVLLKKGIFTEHELLQDVSYALEQIHPEEKTLV